MISTKCGLGCLNRLLIPNKFCPNSYFSLAEPYLLGGGGGGGGEEEGVVNCLVIVSRNCCKRMIIMQFCDTIKLCIGGIAVPVLNVLELLLLSISNHQNQYF